MLLAALPAKAWAAAEMHGLCQSVIGLTRADKSKKQPAGQPRGEPGVLVEIHCVVTRQSCHHHLLEVVA